MRIPAVSAVSLPRGIPRIGTDGQPRTRGAAGLQTGSAAIGTADPHVQEAQMSSLVARRMWTLLIGVLIILALAAAASSARRVPHGPAPAAPTQTQEGGGGVMRVR